MGQRLALIIGSSEYEDPTLAQLKTTDADVNGLADLLKRPEVGGFEEVTTLINQPSYLVRREIARFFSQKRPDDLLLLYFSGHGVKDDHGLLYLAAKDTEHNLLSATAIPAASVTYDMDTSRSRRQVIILDCCHSGAFAQGTKGATGASVGTAAVFQGTGYGRVVLTATDSTQYAWEGDEVIGEAEYSVFTNYLIQGLKTGEADANSDGEITLDELYDYVYSQVVQKTPKQTPGKWSYKEQGNIVIARNLNPVRPAELPPELRHAIESEFVRVREGAINELAKLLQGGHRGMALAAKQALQYLVEHDDSRQLSNLARERLQAFSEVMILGQESVVASEAVPVYEGAKGTQKVIESEQAQSANDRQSQIEIEREQDSEEKQELPRSTYERGELALDIGHQEAARLIDVARQEQIRAGSQPKVISHQSVVNTSGRGKDAVVPEEIKKWNWGAFLLNGFWGLGNQTYIALLSFVPYVNFVMPFVLGAKGNEWAWRNKQWESVEHFQSIQRKWTQWGVRLILAILAFNLFLIMLAYSLSEY